MVFFLALSADSELKNTMLGSLLKQRTFRKLQGQQVRYEPSTLIRFPCLGSDFREKIPSGVGQEHRPFSIESAHPSATPQHHTAAQRGARQTQHAIGQARQGNSQQDSKRWCGSTGTACLPCPIRGGTSCALPWGVTASQQVPLPSSGPVFVFVLLVPLAGPVRIITSISLTGIPV